MERETYLEPSGVRETVERGTVVGGEPVRQETEMRVTEQHQLAEEETVDIPVTKESLQETETMEPEREMLEEGLLPAEGVEEMSEEEWDKVEEEQYIEEEWETQQREAEEEEMEDVPDPVGLEKVAPTAMAPEAPTYAAIASAPTPSEIAQDNPGKTAKKNRPANAAAATPTPVPAAKYPVTATPVTATPVTAPPVTANPATATPVTANPLTVNPLAMNPPVANQGQEVPVLVTVPGTPWPLYDEPAQTQPAEKKPAKAKKARGLGTVPGTPWPIRDAYGMEDAWMDTGAAAPAKARPAAPAPAAKEEAPKKEVDKVDRAPAADRAPTRLPGGQEPAGPNVTPGVGPSVRTRAVPRAVDTAAAKDKERKLISSEMKGSPKEDGAVGKQKAKEDKARETEVKRRQDLALDKNQEEMKRQKEAEKRYNKETKNNKQDAKQDAKQNKREAKERAKQVEQEAKQRKKEAKMAKKQGGTQQQSTSGVTA